MAKPLTRQQRLQIANQASVEPTMLAAPTKGWNTRDALDQMDPLDAVLLDNWFPDVSGVKLRNGYASYATGVGSNPVKTLAEYFYQSTHKFLAASSGGIYDISAAGAAGAPLASGFGSDIWQTEPFLGKLFFANGTDTLQVFDGSSIGNASFTNVTLSTIVGIRQYQQRLFMWQNNSTGFWFAPLNAISGPLSFYDLAAFAPNGGNLTAVTTFSHDGGNGVQDFIVFVMGGGDALIYFGNDPANINVWGLVGRYRLSPPVNPRAVCNYGAEAFLTTFDDHIPLQQQLVALKLGQLPPRSKISGAVQAAVANNLGGFGWQALYYPQGRRLIFNIPNPDGTFNQHVCNTGIQDQPWCRFNYPAQTWGLFKNNLFFGGAGGVVYQADTGTLDNAGTINGLAQQAWNTFGSPSRKRLTASRPLIQTNGNTAVTFSLGFDYGALTIPSIIAVSASGSPWDVSPWDTSPWSSEGLVTTGWYGAAGSGVAIAVGLTIAGTNGATWLRSDLKGETGQSL